jgi:hypothetical protein
MSEEQFHSESGNSLLNNFASEAISDIEKKILPELGEERFSSPLSGAISNFKFIRDIISPVLSDLCRYGINSNEDSKAGLKIKFDSFVTNSDSQTKFIAYNGIDLYISRGDGIVPLRTIANKNDLRKLHSSKGGKEAREAVSAFGRLSKKNITSEVIRAIGLILPPESSVQEIPILINSPTPDVDSSDYTDSFTVIRKLFTRKKVEKSPEPPVDKDRLLRVK